MYLRVIHRHRLDVANTWEEPTLANTLEAIKLMLIALAMQWWCILRMCKISQAESGWSTEIYEIIYRYMYTNILRVLFPALIHTESATCNHGEMIVP